MKVKSGDETVSVFEPMAIDDSHDTEAKAEGGTEPDDDDEEAWSDGSEE